MHAESYDYAVPDLGWEEGRIRFAAEDLHVIASPGWETKDGVPRCALGVFQPENVLEEGCCRVEVRGPRAEEADALHIHAASTIAVRLVFQAASPLQASFQNTGATGCPVPRAE